MVTKGVSLLRLVDWTGDPLDSLHDPTWRPTGWGSGPECTREGEGKVTRERKEEQAVSVGAKALLRFVVVHAKEIAARTLHCSLLHPSLPLSRPITVVLIAAHTTFFFFFFFFFKKTPSLKAPSPIKQRTSVGHIQLVFIHT